MLCGIELFNPIRITCLNVINALKARLDGHFTLIYPVNNTNINLRTLTH